MDYLRPFNAVPPFRCGWLLHPDEGAGCGVRIVREGDEAVSACPDVERMALVLDGSAMLVTPEGESEAKRGDLIFIPAGAAGGVRGALGARWAAIQAAVVAAPKAAQPRVTSIDPTQFTSQGFSHQCIGDRSGGMRSMRINAFQVSPGSGSPDWHIHTFAQMYLILEGEMTVEIGHAVFKAGAETLVFLPPGVAHRNFNAGGGVERHVSLLVPEPSPGAIFDYAVTIHEREAERLKSVPANRR